MNNEKIAEFIKQNRKAKNLTQSELAAKLNVTEKAISRWETGRGTPDISLLIPLAQELGVSVSSILTGEETSKSDDNINELVTYINNKQKSKLSLIIAIILYILAIIEFICFLRIENNPNITWPNYAYILIFVLMTITMLIANFLLNNFYIDKNSDKIKLNKLFLTILFVSYVILILNVLILNRETIYRDIKYNFIPFKNLYDYLTKPMNLSNILSLTALNIIIFIPFQYFLIELFELKTWRINILISILIVSVFELMQMILKVGVCDIDDILLSTIGMMLFNFIYNKLKLPVKKVP